MTHLLFDPKEKWCGVTIPEELNGKYENPIWENIRLKAIKLALSQKIPVRPEDQSRVTMILQQDKLVLHEPEEGYLYPIPVGVEFFVRYSHPYKQCEIECICTYEDAYLFLKKEPAITKKQ